MKDLRKSEHLKYKRFLEHKDHSFNNRLTKQQFNPQKEGLQSDTKNPDIAVTKSWIDDETKHRGNMAIAMIMLTSWKRETDQDKISKNQPVRGRP